MKTQLRILILIFFYLSIESNYGQAPQAIPYQAVARDNAGNLIANQNISVRFSIYDATAGGTVVYKETQTATTNVLGLFTVNIGQGTVLTGTFATIDWGGGSKFIQVEIDATGGVAYVDMGTQQMLSVPYAFYSGNSRNGWNISGNAGTVDGINFLGTTDNVPLSFRVNNQKAGRIDNTLSNTFFGYKTGNANTTGTENVAIGANALLSNTTGFANIAYGTNALQNNITGFGNTATGSYTLNSNTTAQLNTAVGYDALGHNTTGNDNTATGAGALENNVTASGNTATGSNALSHNTTGGGNTANGYRSLFSNTTGHDNIAMGNGALFYNIDGYDNTAIGHSALSSLTTGTENAAIGSSLVSMTSGNFNTAAGSNALNTNLTGSYNSALGFMADVADTNLINATAIGANAYVSRSYSIVLGATSTLNGSSGNDVNGSGGHDVYVGIGTTAPHSKLHVMDGNIYVESSIAGITNGIILNSPDGNCWRITIDNSGNIIRTSITCP